MKDFDIEIVEQAGFYERKRWPYLLGLPLMWILTIWVVFKKSIGLKSKTNTLWFDGLNRSCREIKEGAASWRALDIIYNYIFGEEKSFSTKVGDYWIGMMNAQEVRNRLRLVKRELIKAIKNAAKKEKEVLLLSLASGSAQSVIEAITETKEVNVKVTLLDLDPGAIEYSKKMAEKYGVKEKITFVVGNTSELEKINNGEKPHIIEMVGFLDYRPREKAILLLNRIYQCLAPGGTFLTANILPNPEMFFLKVVINWRMLYRKPEELRNIIVASGFTKENTRIVYEPLKIHAVAICRKP